MGEYPAAEAAAEAADADAVPMREGAVDKGVGRKWIGSGGDVDNDFDVDALALSAGCDSLEGDFRRGEADCSVSFYSRPWDPASTKTAPAGQHCTMQEVVMRHALC